MHRDLDEFATRLLDLPPSSLTLSSIRVPDLLLHREQIRGRIVEVYYAPFDYVNDEARIAIVGITPGLRQMLAAIREARRCISAGMSQAEVESRAKQAASFDGPMRQRLTRWLDGIGVPDYLGISTSDDLFGDSWHLAHATSAVRYPAFVDGTGYGGYNPGELLKVPLFRQYVNEVLAPELARTKKAFIVPLGRSVEEAVDYLVRAGIGEREQYLKGFPHPTPGPRANYNEQAYGRKRESFRDAVRMWYERT